jgi:hypothetical protein
MSTPQQPEEPESQPTGVRRNTIIALVFLLAAIALAGTLGVLRMYQMGG